MENSTRSATNARQDREVMVAIGAEMGEEMPRIVENAVDRSPFTPVQEDLVQQRIREAVAEALNRQVSTSSSSSSAMGAMGPPSAATMGIQETSHGSPSQLAQQPEYTPDIRTGFSTLIEREKSVDIRNYRINPTEVINKIEANKLSVGISDAKRRIANILSAIESTKLRLTNCR